MLSRRSTGTLDGRAVFVFIIVFFIRYWLREDEYQEGNVWYHWYDAIICDMQFNYYYYSQISVINDKETDEE